MNDLRGFVQTVDTPKEKEWEWNGYSIQWMENPTDDPWPDNVAYWVEHQQRSIAHGCATLAECIEDAHRHNASWEAAR